MAVVKWIKIVTDIFDDEKMLIIESMPEADSIIVIWFKLLCMAGKTNNSGVFLLNDKIAYTDEMLAAIFRRSLNVIRLALKTFQNLGMIEIINNAITIPNWSKHQTLDQLEERKEYMKNYMQKYRENQKLLASGEGCKVNSNINGKANSKANVNSLDIDIDIDIDKEIEKDRELYKEVDEYLESNKKEVPPSSVSEETANIPYAEIVEYLNKKGGANYRSSSKATREKIKARCNEGFTLNDFKTVIDKKVAEWKGNNMEQYLRPETLFGTKFEGYLNQKKGMQANNPKQKDNFNNYEQRQYDYDDLEKKLLGWDND